MSHPQSTKMHARVSPLCVDVHSTQGRNEQHLLCPGRRMPPSPFTPPNFLRSVAARGGDPDSAEEERLHHRSAACLLLPPALGRRQPRRFSGPGAVLCTNRLCKSFVQSLRLRAGSAGTGKSFLLNCVLSGGKPGATFVTAPTVLTPLLRLMSEQTRGRQHGNSCCELAARSPCEPGVFALFSSI